MRTWQRRIGLAIVGAGLVVLAGVGIAGASIPSASGVFYGCVKGPSSADPGELIVKDDEGTGNITCGSDATKIEWNQTGPQGPAGATGPSTAGPGGLDIIIVTGNVSPSNPNAECGSDLGYDEVNGATTCQLIVYCPPDHPYVLSGGYNTGDQNLGEAEMWDSGVGTTDSNGQPNSWEYQETVESGLTPGAKTVTICSQ